MRSGVYRWPSAASPAEVERAAGSAGWRFVHLDTSGVEDKLGFLDRAAAAFELPDYFGRNWDALADCLGYVGGEQGTIVLWDAWSRLAAADGRAFDVALELLRERAADSSAGGFVVLMRGDPAAEEPAT